MYSKEEKKQLSLDFWQGFKKYGETQAALNYQRKRWMLNQTQIRGLVFRFNVDRDNAWVILELQHKNENRRLRIFEILERYRVVVEEGFENGLVWEFFHEREDNKQEVCRIYTKLENIDWHKQENWPEIYNFFITNMLQMEKNYLEVKEILKEELKK